MVVDAEYEVSKHVQHHMNLYSIELSPVFGHRFNNFGVMAGLNLKLSNSTDSSIKNICKAVSLRIVLPNSAGRITV